MCRLKLLIVSMVMSFSVVAANDNKIIEVGECTIPVPSDFYVSKKNEYNYWRKAEFGGGGIRVRLPRFPYYSEYKKLGSMEVVSAEVINSLDVTLYRYTLNEENTVDLSVLKGKGVILEVSNMPHQFAKNMAVSCK